ncbi:MAG: hypothetical protein JO246_01385 [Frankiaceae bacterium]|nr:hypothetical protein [Frankiaceae bacterium]MBV9869661.1 hypothetical protein [Frankiaceae bacterium]
MITPRRAVIAALLLGTAAAGLTLAVAPAHAAPDKQAAASIAPTATAWYDVTRETKAAPGLPQPGVGKHDLVVDGLTADAGQLPVAPPVTVPVEHRVAALTAMSFLLPTGTSAGTLRLDLSATTLTNAQGRLPGGVSPIACPTTSKWKPGAQQVGSAAPSYSCKRRSVIGALAVDKKSIEFTSIGRLTHGRRLSFIILPGTIGLERLVFTRPGPSTLKLLSFSTPVPPPTSPPTPKSNQTSSTPRSNNGPLSNGGGGSGTDNGGGLPPLGATSSGGSDNGAQPTVAETAAPRAVVRATHVSALDDNRARWAAIALLVGLVVAATWLSSTDPAVASVSALRVLRAAWANEPPPVRTAPEFGVGRFRSPRHGPPPTI